MQHQPDYIAKEKSQDKTQQVFWHNGNTEKSLSSTVEEIMFEVPGQDSCLHNTSGKLPIQWWTINPHYKSTIILDICSAEIWHFSCSTSATHSRAGSTELNFLAVTSSHQSVYLRVAWDLARWESSFKQKGTLGTTCPAGYKDATRNHYTITSSLAVKWSTILEDPDIVNNNDYHTGNDV